VGYFVSTAFYRVFYSFPEAFYSFSILPNMLCPNIHSRVPHLRHSFIVSKVGYFVSTFFL
jgi:hypothetical protein